MTVLLYGDTMGMTNSHRMAEQARRATRHLASATEVVGKFTLARIHKDGGFRGRDEQSDLYYSIFGIESIRALEIDHDWAATRQYLAKFRQGQTLDFMHLTSLIRCRYALAMNDDVIFLTGAMSALESFRSDDGGYSPFPHSAQGSTYGCYLAHAAYQDLGAPMPHPDGLLTSLNGLRAADGAYGNDPEQIEGTTTTTVGAILVLHDLGETIPDSLLEWLQERQHSEGGFVASPATPAPDLLSTATALYALHVAGSFEGILTQRCIDFVEGLWHEEGAFCGSWFDDVPDCEYTFYGLLSLGCLMS